MFLKLYTSMQSRLAATQSEAGAVAVEYVILVAAIAAAITAGVVFFRADLIAALTNLIP